MLHKFHRNYDLSNLSFSNQILIDFFLSHQKFLVTRKLCVTTTSHAEKELYIFILSLFLWIFKCSLDSVHLLHLFCFVTLFIIFLFSFISVIFHSTTFLLLYDCSLFWKCDTFFIAIFCFYIMFVVVFSLSFRYMLSTIAIFMFLMSDRCLIFFFFLYIRAREYFYFMIILKLLSFPNKILMNRKSTYTKKK